MKKQVTQAHRVRKDDSTSETPQHFCYYPPADDKRGHTKLNRYFKGFPRAAMSHPPGHSYVGLLEPQPYEEEGAKEQSNPPAGIRLAAV